MKVLMILLTISIIGIWAFVVYMNHLNKLIDKLEKKIDTLQYQTDDVLHDIDVVNKNIRNYYASLKKLEDEKTDAKINLKSLWHDLSEEPQGKYYIVCQDTFENVFPIHSIEVMTYHQSWEKFVMCECIVRWAYVKDLFPKENKKLQKKKK